MQTDKNINLAPIILFTFNRVDLLEQTIEALKNNELAKESELIIFSDASKNPETVSGVDEVRRYIDQITGFKKVTITKRQVNFGLAKNIIDGVTQTMNEYGKAIILEDDLITNPYFLKFMNHGLIKYENNTEVASIHGFTYPIEGLPNTFFLKGADCWGWASWKRSWDLFEVNGKTLLDELEKRSLTREFDFQGYSGFLKMLKDQIEGKNNSWAVRWYASMFLRNMYTLYPGKSLVRNIGFDSGTHCNDGEDSLIFGVLHHKEIQIKDIQIEHDQKSYQKFVLFFKGQTKNIFIRIINKLLKIAKLH